MQDYYNSPYVGGSLQSIRHAKYGLKGKPKGKKDLLGGFEAPDPRIIVQGGFKAPDPRIKVQGGKRQTKFKKTAKGQEYLKTLDKEIKKIDKENGIKNMSPKALETQVKNERKKFRSIVNKGATQIKKAEINKGTTKKKAMEAKKKFMDAMKESLKRLINKHILKALKEFNNRLSQ